MNIYVILLIIILVIIILINCNNNYQILENFNTPIPTHVPASGTTINLNSNLGLSSADINVNNGNVNICSTETKTLSNENLIIPDPQFASNLYDEPTTGNLKVSGNLILSKNSKIHMGDIVISTGTYSGDSTTNSGNGRNPEDDTTFEQITNKELMSKFDPSRSLIYNSCLFGGKSRDICNKKYDLPERGTGNQWTDIYSNTKTKPAQFLRFTCINDYNDPTSGFNTKIKKNKEDKTQTIIKDIPGPGQVDMIFNTNNKNVPSALLVRGDYLFSNPLNDDSTANVIDVRKINIINSNNNKYIGDFKAS